MIPCQVIDYDELDYGNEDECETGSGPDIDCLCVADNGASCIHLLDEDGIHEQREDAHNETADRDWAVALKPKCKPGNDHQHGARDVYLDQVAVEFSLKNQVKS